MLVRLASERQTIGGKAGLLGRASVLDGDPESVNRTLERVQKATEVELLRVARQYLTPERTLEVRIERNLLGAMFGGGKGKAAEENAPITAKPEVNAPKPGRPNVVRPTDFPTKAPQSGLAAFQ